MDNPLSSPAALSLALSKKFEGCACSNISPPLSGKPNNVDSPSGASSPAAETIDRRWLAAGTIIRDRAWLTCSDPRALEQGLESELSLDAAVADVPSMPVFRRNQKVVSYSVFEGSNSSLHTKLVNAFSSSLFLKRAGRRKEHPKEINTVLLIPSVFWLIRQTFIVKNQSKKKIELNMPVNTSVIQETSYISLQFHLIKV